MADLSYETAIEMAEKVAKSGAQVYFKFTCEYCGERVLFQEPNSIYAAGECAACGEITDPITGYGLMVTFTAEGRKSEMR